jgi:HAD superfamily hydrolase (TIGR01549 family)
MIDTVLLDLDGTLLHYSEYAQFVDRLFSSAAEYLADWVAPDLFGRALMAGIRAMDENKRQGPSNAEAFASAFCPIASASPEETKDAFERYYRHAFPTLRHLTSPSPEAQHVLQWLVSNGRRIVIATGFQTPIVAVAERLKWAGVPMDQFHYEFVTTVDNMHASKPHPEYYEEVLEHLACARSRCLMVGDDWEHDIAPAMATGIPAYWISEQPYETTASQPLLFGCGSLGNFRRWIEAGGLGNPT